jgi:hypothetical protein
MNQSGSLALIKSTLSTITIHTTVILKLSSWLLKALHKIMKTLWRDSDVVQVGKCMVA